MLPSNTICCVFTEIGTAPLRCYSDPSGTFWFIAKDALALLAISAANKALTRLEAHDKAAAGTGNPYGLHKHTITISEQGLYHLTITSRKPSAKAFKDRLLSHISPMLRTMVRATRNGVV